MREASGRSGGARRVVVEFLGRQECCVSAQEIHDAVRAGGARVGIASVYRTLDGLDDSGSSSASTSATASPASSAPTRAGEHHHHLVCGDCGKVEPFEDPALEAAIAGIAGGRGYEVAAHEVVLRGACGDCRVA